MTTSEPTVPELFQAAGRHLKHEFERIRETNPHPGEKGSEVEDVLRLFLNQHLPQRFRATSGILIDSENNRSKQTDVIVYDALSSPVYRASERLQILPAHTTAAVIEVKSTLNTQSLRDGYAKIESCKRLHVEPMRPVDRAATGTSLHASGPLGVIFAFSSELTLRSLAEKVVELNKDYDSDFWPDQIVALDRGIVDYAVSAPGTDHVRHAKMVTRSPTSKDAFGPPPFYFELLERELGESTLNHFFLTLLAQLMFFPLRAGLPHFDVLRGTERKDAIKVTAYQQDLSGKLRDVPPELYGSHVSPAPHVDVFGPEGNLVGRASFSRWQDGACVWWQGRLPLELILKAVLKDPHRVQVVQHFGMPGIFMSSVIPLTEEEFRGWPDLLSKKSNLSGKVVES